MSGERHYRFTERRHGFQISAAERVPVIVRMTRTGFHIATGNGPRQLRMFGDYVPVEQRSTRPGGESFVSLVQYRALVRALADGLMSRWTPRHGKQPPMHVRATVLEATRRAIGKRVHAQWLRLREQAVPRVLSVQRSVFAATLRDHELLHTDQLYEHPFLVSDIVRFRAAAVLPGLCQQFLSRRTADHCGVLTGRLSPELQLRMMEDWHALYSVNGRPYRSLRRTLMQLPGGIPDNLLFHLCDVDLQRPVTDRVELIAVLSQVAENRRVDSETAVSHQKVLMHARRDEIRSGMERAAEHIGWPVTHRRARDIAQFVRFITELPEPHYGRLGGLVEKAIRWHRSQERRQRAREVLELTPDQRTALPPIALPTHPGIRFLATVGEIQAEGKDMGHCIATCADNAVKGHSYLFHCDYRGETASIEVDASGVVMQSRGPFNEDNHASAFARRLLRRWGAAIARTVPPAMLRGRVADDIPF